jgi:hypothetical protein
MRRFTKQDENLLYIVRSTAEQLEIGTWADCEKIYNQLATYLRTEDGLRYKYKVMEKAVIKNRVSSTQWNAKKKEVKSLLLGETCDASQICICESVANWQNRGGESILTSPLFALR